jgi:hypothetical protein
MLQVGVSELLVAVSGIGMKGPETGECSRRRKMQELLFELGTPQSSNRIYDVEQKQ